MNLDVKIYNANSFGPTLRLEVSRFLESFDNFNYFQSTYFFDALNQYKKTTPHYIVATSEGNLVGVLMFYRHSLFSIPVLSLLTSRLIIWGAPIVYRDNHEVFEKLLSEFDRCKPTTIYIQVRNLVDTSKYDELFKRAGFQYVEQLEIEVNLGPSEEDLWKNVYTKRRNQIRRAVKEGCRVELQNTPAALEGCYDILKEVYQRAKLPLHPLSHFEALLRFSDAHAGLRIFKVIWQEQLIACMLCLVYKDHIFDYYAGAYSRHFKKYPNDLLPWEVFKWAKENGFTRFYFGGAGTRDVPFGVREYKKQFGGELVSYGRYEKSRYLSIFQSIRRVFFAWQKFRK